MANPFKPGDKVTCIDITGLVNPHITQGETYTVLGVSGPYISIVGMASTVYMSTRFAFIFAIEMSKRFAQSSSPDPDKPFPYPESEEDRDKKAQESLRVARKELRKFLHGTDE